MGCYSASAKPFAASTPFPEYRDRITQDGDVIAFRNQIVHGYATVRGDIVCEIVQSHLPRLRTDADELLGELDPLRNLD